MVLRISSEWNVVSPLAGDVAVQILAIPRLTVQLARTFHLRSAQAA